MERKKIPVEDAKYIVAIDFGTTFSKAAYAVSADVEPGFLDIEKMVHLVTDWPKQEAGAGAKCCKTKTCVWYVPGPEPQTFELKAWGWEAYVKYKLHVQSLMKRFRSTYSAATQVGGLREEHQPNGDVTRGASSRQLEYLSRQQGYMIDNFKVWLYDNTSQNLPKGLSLLTVITDFLKGLSTYIIQELQLKYGNDVCKRDIKWCITVPAMWDECHRQLMEDSAEMAGLVLGPLCTDYSASVHDLITVVEPEAASIYSHNILNLSGTPKVEHDTFVVVDLGGGTTDLVTHKIVGATKRSNVRVKEVTSSSGGLFGGVHVDRRLLEFLRQRISTPSYDCFGIHEKLYPAHILKMLIQWGHIKAGFDGESAYGQVHELDVPSILARSWERNDKKFMKSAIAHPDHPSAGLSDNYDLIELTNGFIKKIFDDDIEPILDLIEQRMKASVDYILVVGGFSESPYVRNRIMEKSWTYNVDGPQRDKKPRILFPRNADTAVVRGAVALGVLGEWESFVKSRIAKKTYGFDGTVPFDKSLHPSKYLIHDQKNKRHKLCDNAFLAFIHRGEEVPFDACVEYNTRPLYREGFPDDDDIPITLYSTSKLSPKFVFEKGVSREATCTIRVPSRGTTPKAPRLRIAVHFGGTRLRLVVWGVNFSSDRIQMPPVKLRCVAQNQPEYKEMLDRRTHRFKYGHT